MVKTSILLIPLWWKTRICLFMCWVYVSGFGNRGAVGSSVSSAAPCQTKASTSYSKTELILPELCAPFLSSHCFSLLVIGNKLYKSPCAKSDLPIKVMVSNIPVLISVHNCCGFFVIIFCPLFSVRGEEREDSVVELNCLLVWNNNNMSPSSCVCKPHQLEA